MFVQDDSYMQIGLALHQIEHQVQQKWYMSW